MIFSVNGAGCFVRVMVRCYEELVFVPIFFRGMVIVFQTQPFDYVLILARMGMAESEQPIFPVL